MSKIATILLLLLALVVSTTAQYHYNRAGSFNGTTSYIAVPHSSELDITGSFTIEAWVNPTNVNIPNIVEVVSKGIASNFNGYELMLDSGRVRVRTNGATRLIGDTRITSGTWSHIATTFDASTNTFSVYVDGTLDSTRTIAGSPVSNSDSLFFSKGLNSMFSGFIDYVRLWNIARTTADIARDRFTPLGASRVSEGVYNGLVGAWRLNGNPYDEAGSSFDDGFSRNMSYLDLRQKAVNHVDYNSTVLLDGTNGYCAAAPNSAYDATTAITLEAWVKRDTTGTQNSTPMIVNKSGGVSRLNYALYINSFGGLYFYINWNGGGGSGISRGGSVMTSRWTHVAATYNSSTGLAVLYVNGDSVAGSVFAGNPVIESNADSVFVGGIGASGLAANKWRGQIDQVRIWKDVARTSAEIRQGMYRNVDYETSPLPTNVVVWGFDGKNADDMVNLSLSFPTREMHFKGNARLTSSHRQTNAELTSPLLRDDAGGFGDPTYIYSTRRFFVPDAFPTGVLDSVYVSAGGTVTDIKVFVLMNHTFVDDMTLTLTSPTGVSVDILGTGVGGGNNDLMTIFTDAADSLPGVTSTSGFRTPFSPMVRPLNAFAPFIGTPRQGWWKMRFADIVGADLGYVSGWGIQTSPLVDVPIAAELPLRFELMQNYPNPFNPSTEIRFAIPKQTHVSLKIYDLLGREVATLVDEVKAPGTYGAKWNASPFASGVYFYRIRAEGFVEVKKMMLVK